MRPSRGLPGDSICLTLTDVTGRLRIRDPYRKRKDQMP